jgi:hypothetical protein
MSRLITTETPEQARARINRQLIAQGGVPHSDYGRDNPRSKRHQEGYQTAHRVVAPILSELDIAIAACDRALDAAKNAVSRCKALGVIN